MPPDLATLDDLALRDRILGGDRAAAAYLFEREVEGLYEFAHWRLGGERELVEDVVQDAFLVALESLKSFDGRSSFHSWLAGIVRNKVRALRRKRRPKPLADVLAESEEEIDAILAQVSREPLPEHALERRETRELVGATLSSLTPEYRRALIAKYVGGVSVAEIAAGERKSVKAAESTLTRARIAFARVFELLAKRRGGIA